MLLLAALTACGPIAMAFYVPLLPLIAAEFDDTPQKVQLTVSAYFAAFATAQLIIGPMSDYFGRRPIAIIGVFLFGSASFLTVYVNSVEALVGARIIQALGGAAGVVLARAIVKDTNATTGMAAKLSYIVMVSALAPMISPTLGGMIADAYNWRTAMFVLGALSVPLLLALVLRLEETGKNLRVHSNIKQIFGNYVKVFSNKKFLLFTLTAAFFGAAYFAFMTGMPYIMARDFGLSASQYGLWVTVLPLGYLLGNAASSRLIKKLHPHGTLRLGTIVSTIGVATLIIASLLLPEAPVTYFLPVAIMTFGHGISMANAIALALDEVPELAGTASAALGSLQMMVAAMGAVLVSVIGVGSVWAIFAIMMTAHLMALFVYFMSEK